MGGRVIIVVNFGSCTFLTFGFFIVGYYPKFSELIVHKALGSSS